MDDAICRQNRALFNEEKEKKKEKKEKEKKENETSVVAQKNPEHRQNGVSFLGEDAGSEIGLNACANCSRDNWPVFDTKHALPKIDQLLSCQFSITALS